MEKKAPSAKVEGFQILLDLNQICKIIVFTQRKLFYSFRNFGLIINQSLTYSCAFFSPGNRFSDIGRRVHRIFTLTLEDFTPVQRLLQFGRAKFFKHKRITKYQNIYGFDFCQFVFAISYYSQNNSLCLLMVPRISLMLFFVYILLLIFLILFDLNNFPIRI